MPQELVKGCSDNVVVFIAACGNHFLNYGVTEGMYLFFDLEKEYKEGQLSCFVSDSENVQSKFKISDRPIKGYTHMGRLVVTVKNYEV